MRTAFVLSSNGAAGVIPAALGNEHLLFIRIFDGISNCFQGGIVLRVMQAYEVIIIPEEVRCQSGSHAHIPADPDSEMSAITQNAPSGTLYRILKSSSRARAFL